MTAALVGRSRESARLARAIDRGDIRLIVVRGPAGSGKTALCESALEAVRSRGALVGSGKYGQGEGQSTFAPIMRALSAAAGAGLDQLYDPRAGATDMARALGPALEILQSSGFQAGVVSRASATAPAGRREGALRLTAAALALTRWLEGFGLPLVLFVDDWGRAPAEARALLLALAAEEGDHAATVILAERDEEIGDTGLAGDPRATLLELGPLARAERLELLGEAIGREPALAIDEWLGADGPRLPFDILQAARSIREGGVVRRDGRGWTVDPAAAAALGDLGMTQGVLRRVRALPIETRQVALAAALWGDEAPTRDLCQALNVDRPRLEAAVDALAEAGLLRRRPGGVDFVHDRLREDFNGGATEEDVVALAGAMSERLAAHPVAGGRVPAAALRLRRRAGLDSASPAIWRDLFALGAAEARSRSESAAANAFADGAWSLRARDISEDPAADRRLIREAVLSAADQNQAGEVADRADLLLSVSHRIGERAEDYELAMAALRRSGAGEASWSLARQGLAEFGVRIPTRVGWARLAAAALAWRMTRRLGLIVPRAHTGPGDPGDPFTRIANAAAVAAFERSPALGAYVGFRGSIRARAKSPDSAFWMGTDTFLLAALGAFEAAARAGEAAAAHLDAQEIARAASLYRGLYWGVIWRRPLASLRARCLEIRDMALAEGDLVYAAYALRNYLIIGWRTVASLPQLELEVREGLREARRLADGALIGDLLALLATIDTLGRPRSPPRPGGMAPEPRTAADIRNPLVEIEAASLGGDFDGVIRLAALCRMSKSGFNSHPGGVSWRFHETLARLKTDLPPRRADLRYIRRAARLNPTDHLARLRLLLAEDLRRRGRRDASLAAYAAAVQAAEDAPSALEAGLAAQCAAQGALAAGRPDLADRYGVRAQAIWAAAGARSRLDVEVAGPALQAAVERLADARAQTAAAERDARAKSRFLADVAHELRTPMQGIQGLLDLAGREPASFDLPAFTEVFSSLKTVVDDLTDLGAAASGELRMTPAPVQVSKLIASEVAIMRSASDRREFDWAVTVDPDFPDGVLTDGHRLRQVIRNLVSNAVKYGGDRASITLRLAPDDPGMAVLVVEDGGPGFSAAELLRLFEPFDRAGREGDGLGLGLGLALSRRVAKSLGGGLEAENSPAGGARFTLRFAAPAAPAAPEGADAAPAAPASRILLVEDAPLIRRLIGAILDRRRHTIVEAEDGVEAERLLLDGVFDLLVIDLSMPRMGGLELLRRIARRGRTPPTIVLTASSDEAAAQSALSLGARVVLRKPVAEAELVETVNRLFAQPPIGAPADDLGSALAGLTLAARAELIRRSEQMTHALARGAAPETAEVHKIAGLAAQFGWPRLAEAADRLERDLRREGGGAARASIEAFIDALAALTAEGPSA